MDVLVTGGAGYLGSTLVPMLLEAGHEVTVADRFYFGREPLEPALAAHPERLRLVRQDVRCLEPVLFEGVDAVVALAGISNDPACDLDPELTRSINFESACRVARAAKQAGVRRLVLASSCSVYGQGRARALTEDSETRPMSLYAECKLDAERALLELSDAAMAVTALRLSTLFGVSGRMRFDLALNVMTLTAHASRTVRVVGGGKQWRPFVHLRDAARAFLLALGAPAEQVGGRVYNVGADEHNLAIQTLAERVRDAVPGTTVEMLPGDPDRRSYHVCFERVRRELGLWPTVSIDDGIREVLAMLRSGAMDPGERSHYTLRQYRFLYEAERVFRELQIGGSLLSPGSGGAAGGAGVSG